MAKWLCKQHGKTNHIPACIHLKQNVDDRKIFEFKLILEELSLVDSSYITSLICHDCAEKIGVKNEAIIYFDPQIRKFEQDEDFDEEDAQYEGIFDKLDERLVSICKKCLLNVFPEFQLILAEYKKNAVEIAKKEI
jgi:hypothetical protein